MTKKSKLELIESLAAAVAATANKNASDNEPAITADEAETLVCRVIKQQAKALVAATCHVEEADVVFPVVDAV